MIVDQLTPSALYLGLVLIVSFEASAYPSLKQLLFFTTVPALLSGAASAPQGRRSTMDTTLPDAGPAQPSSSAAQDSGVVSNEVTNGDNVSAPRIRVDGMLNLCGPALDKTNNSQ